MQNKGFVRFFAISLALVCLFYLSFTFVTNYWDKQAKEIAQAEIDKVCTPGGWTIKGLNAMEEAGFTNAVIQGLLTNK